MDLQDLQKRQAEKNEVNWITAAFMAAFHVGAIAALFFFTWKALFVAMFLWWVSGSLGIGMSYHRLLTHRGYKTPKWVEYFLTICATLALEGPGQAECAIVPERVRREPRQEHSAGKRGADGVCG